MPLALLAWIVLGISIGSDHLRAAGSGGIALDPLPSGRLAGSPHCSWPLEAARQCELQPSGMSTGRVSLAVAVAVSLLTAVHWAGPVLNSLDVGIYRQDSLWYHLPIAAWFAQTGSTGGLLFTDPLKLTVWYYPDNSELIHSIGMVVLGNDLLSPLLNFGWMGSALLAAWCIGRPFGLAPVTLLERCSSSTPT